MLRIDPSCRRHAAAVVRQPADAATASRAYASCAAPCTASQTLPRYGFKGFDREHARFGLHTVSWRAGASATSGWPGSARVMAAADD